MQTIQILQSLHQTKYPKQLSMHNEVYIEQSMNMDKILLDIGVEIIRDQGSPDLSHRSRTSGSSNDTNNFFEGDNVESLENVMEIVTPQTQHGYDSETSSPREENLLTLRVSPAPPIVSQSPSVSSEAVELSTQPAQTAMLSNDDSSVEEEHHYEVVRESYNLLLLDPNMETRAEAGYVNNKRTNAKVYPELSENLISQARVLQLGLDILPHDEEDHIKQIVTGRGIQEATKGIVVLTWSSVIPVPGQTRGFKVPCYVCNHIPQPLIFGQSFLDRQRDYSPTNRSDTNRPPKISNMWSDLGAKDKKEGGGTRRRR
jgi:hypothetical protein